MLPIDDVMKANFSRLTISHHGDFCPSVSVASMEPEVMSREHPGQYSGLFPSFRLHVKHLGIMLKSYNQIKL